MNERPRTLRFPHDCDGRLKGILGRYGSLLETIDGGFNESRDAHPKAIPCKPGCSHCCSGLFGVKPLDVLLAMQGILTLTVKQQNQIQSRCQRLLRHVKTAFPDFVQPFRIHHIGTQEFGIWVENLKTVCPLLDDRGWCSIHAFRPRICRLAGAVFVDIATGQELDDFCILGSDARKKTGFGRVRFPLVEMDACLLELEMEFRHHLPSVESGMTFLASGLVEFQKSWNLSLFHD